MAKTKLLELGYLSDDAVGRIIDNCGIAPAELDRGFLKQMLEMSYWGTMVRTNHGPTKGVRTKQKEKHKRIAKLADELAKLVHDQFQSSHLYGEYIDVLEQHRIDGLSEAWKITDRLLLLREAAEIHDPQPKELGSPLRLFCRRLISIYERFFDKEAGGSRPKDGGEATGPYVRFGQAVGHEFGITVKPETLVRYMRDDRTGTG